MIKLQGPRLEPLSGNKPKQIVIFLHGLGANGEDLIDLAYLFRDAIPDAIFISPNAPYSNPFVPNGYQWFDLETWDEDYIYNGIKQACPILENFIRECAGEFSLGMKDVLLIGFSQGSMMSLHLGPRLKEELAGIIALSGSLIKPQELAAEVTSKPRILIAHGDEDEVVPFEEMEKASIALNDLGINAETFIEENAGHTISESAIQASIQFIKKIFS